MPFFHTSLFLFFFVRHPSRSGCHFSLPQVGTKNLAVSVAPHHGKCEFCLTPKGGGAGLGPRRGEVDDRKGSTWNPWSTKRYRSVSSFKANQQNSGLHEVIHPNKVPAASSLAFYFSFALGSYSKRIPFLVDVSSPGLRHWKTHPNFEDLPQPPTSTGGATTTNGTSTGSEGLKGGLRCCSTSHAMTVDGRNPAPGGMMVFHFSNAIPCLFPLFVETLLDPLWCKFLPSAVWVTVTYHSKRDQVTGCIMCGKGNRNLANGLWVLTKPVADTTLIMHHKVRCGFSNVSPMHRKWLTKWPNQVAAYQAILADLHSGPPVMAKALKSLGERCLANMGTGEGWKN